MLTIYTGGILSLFLKTFPQSFNIRISMWEKENQLSIK